MIVIDQEQRIFTLHTSHTTYQMQADPYHVLLHAYYGPRVEEDMTYLIRRADRSHTPNPDEAGNRRDYSLDTLPQEYSTCGVGDYRIPSLEVEQADGSHAVDLRYTGYEVRKGKYTLEGLPAFWGQEAETLILFLEDPASHVAAELYYGVFEDVDLITRAVRIVNRGEKPVRLLKAASLCLDLPYAAPLDIITFAGRHMMERCPTRTPLAPGIQGVGTTRGLSSHQNNPFVMLCRPDAGEEHGLCYGAMLLYSGSFEALAERSQMEDCRLVMGINPYHFSWTLEPGGAFQTPEAAMVCSPSGFGQMSRRFHRAIREHLLRDPYEGRRRPVLVNNWEATTFDFDADKLVEIAQAAAPMGIELLVMDDGWFGDRDDDYRALGDWAVNLRKLPGGLEALVPRIQELGMRFGIWVEPEMISEDSALYRQHPDWALAIPGRAHTRGRSQLVLDFSRQDVRDHIYGALKAVLSSAEITYVKWDANRTLATVWSAQLPSERQGEVYHRYVLGVYDMLERLHQDFPQMLIEGCAGGGGRFDAGMLYYTPQIWCSDNTDAVDRLRIQYGTSFAYPVSAMGAHVSAVPNAGTLRTTPLETRGVVAMAGTFGYEMDLSKTTPEERELMARQVRFFKEHYDLIQRGDYYRLTDPFENGPFTAWEHVSPDRREALASVVTGPVCGNPPFRTLYLRGLDPALRYRVEEGAAYSGAALMEGGYPLPMELLMGDYQSFQLYLKAE